MVKTPDQRARLMSFYSELFGWMWEVGMQETDFYSLARHAGRPVIGLGQNEMGAGHLVTYFATEDIDASATLAVQLGGEVLLGPLRVMDLGRTAVVVDPVGVVHGLWQPLSLQGFGVVDEVSSPGWFDHASPDPARAAQYYEKLTGCAIHEPDPGTRILQVGDQWLASISYDQIPGRRAQWNPIFIVDSLAISRETVRNLGGTVIVEEMPVLGSSISVFVEPVMNTTLTVAQAPSESA